MEQPVNDARKEDDYKKWLDFARRRVGEKNDPCDLSTAPCLRISNERYAKDATFEDRLTHEDRLLLKELGIKQ